MFGGPDHDTISGGDGETPSGGPEPFDPTGGSSCADCPTTQDDPRLQDTISGGPEADTIDGGFGNDTLNGDDGSDHITGGPGDDVIAGGKGVTPSPAMTATTTCMATTGAT